MQSRNVSEGSPQGNAGDRKLWLTLLAVRLGKGGQAKVAVHVERL
jgi:hypothetical protein